VCKAKKVEDLDDDLDDDFDDDELADFSGSNYFSRYLGISPDQIVEIGRYIPEGQDTFVRYQVRVCEDHKDEKNCVSNRMPGSIFHKKS